MSEMGKLIDQINIAEEKGDIPKAFKLYKKAAELGNVVAMAEVGSLYLTGKGGEQNNEDGFRWCLKAAENGYPNAMAMVARMYELGIGTAPDIDEALNWYIEAANAGEPHAKKFMDNLFKSNTDN